MKQISESRVLFLGAGAMSESMIKGLLEARLIPAAQIIVCNRRNTARLQDLQQRYAVQVIQDKRTACREADMIVLAVKPFDVVAALQEIAPYLSAQQLIISVAAGISTAAIEACCAKSIPVIRAMPNTSSSVQASATALCAGRQATAEHLDLAQDLFAAIGISVLVEEEQMNAVTGLSGTGPAYFYYVTEALLAAGQACGLSAETSRVLLVQTLYGAARMLQETGKDPEELRLQVTSPNGTTMAGIAVLDQGDTRLLLKRAVQAATSRALEMGQQIENAFAQLQASGRSRNVIQ
ncbi:pyrroline-5-carboxylate reductase [Ktedonosporobacter rubrisoli]|uniref:Pyrroline-5-carboxylate reductase n=1 Tax=Ktedonosporobacter rubrisoli TaxID=2509675 RepID=A0A4P6JMW2_KTERU|nr:pyrroline-5-carboxylate reductase [Ktedonosporobacter rubrisoli]QBD76483.1 pyrroline-5-carboxylate reductase [Ktedonosporobacter rubrisoli]